MNLKNDYQKVAKNVILDVEVDAVVEDRYENVSDLLFDYNVLKFNQLMVKFWN
jgi:hypothetical protein